MIDCGLLKFGGVNLKMGILEEQDDAVVEDLFLDTSINLNIELQIYIYIHVVEWSLYNFEKQNSLVPYFHSSFQILDSEHFQL